MYHWPTRNGVDRAKGSCKPCKTGIICSGLHRRMICNLTIVSIAWRYARRHPRGHGGEASLLSFFVQPSYPSPSRNPRMMLRFPDRRETRIIGDGNDGGVVDSSAPFLPWSFLRGTAAAGPPVYIPNVDCRHN